ncbi:MAG: ComEC/Rec2 family competence protein [Atopobiaceae bacterium]|nr:ComEC/Rec2 family competence protein [Atopobiaceae bacterium]
MSPDVERPPRPHLPVALFCLVATIVCERQVMEGRSLFHVAVMTLATCLAMTALSAVLFAARGGWETSRGDLWEAARLTLLVCACCTLAACCVASAASAQMKACSDAFSTTPVSRWELVIRDDPSPGEWSYSYVADAVLDGHRLGRVTLTCDDDVGRGQTLRCVGRFAEAGDDEWGRSCRARGICGSVRAVRVLSVGPASWLLRPILALRSVLVDQVAPSSSDARALLAGIVLGRRSELRERGLDDDFSRAGLAHLVAVSGTHIAIVCAVPSELLERAKAAPWVRIASVTGLGWAYVLLCGVPASAVRAWLMSVVAGGAVLAGRRGHALSAVGVTGVMLCLLQPGTAGELGFVLSVSCVCGLCALGGYAGYALESLLPHPSVRGIGLRARRLLDRGYDALRLTLAASIVAQAASLPFVAGAFGTLSVIGPIACLLAGPLFVACMWLGLAAVAVAGLPVVGGFVLRVADMPCAALLACARGLGRLPVACVPIERPAFLSAVVVIALLAVLLIWPKVSPGIVWRVSLALVVPLAAWHLWWVYLAPPRIVILDVGQGDAILVQDGPHTLLVDAGPEGPLARALFRNHVSHLDAVLVTHLHDDHYAGLSSLVGVVGVDELMVAEGVASGARRVLSDCMRDLGMSDVTELSYGDAIDVGRFHARVVWPREVVDGSENAHSVELVVEGSFGREGLVALLTGDAEREETGAVVAGGDVGDVDLLKVGHHGSEVSIYGDDATAIDAEVAVASAAEGNSYGHPDPACVSVLEASGSLFLCTKDVGDVEVRPGVSGPRVRCQRGGRFPLVSRGYLIRPR